MTRLDHDYQKILKINQDDIIMDVGAAEGLFSIPLIDKAKYIIIIEPNPDYFSKLQEIFKNIDKVSLVNKGVWNKIEKRKIKLEGWSSNILASRTIEIYTDTIDNIANNLGFRKIDFMKMDIEGAEIEALQGADFILNNTDKIVVAAYHPRPDLKLKETCYWIENHLRNKGFQTIITGDKLVHGWR